MNPRELRIVLQFNADDQAWIRRGGFAVPRFFDGHGVPPARGDVLRIEGRQFLIHGRVWEHDADGPLLRIFLGQARAESDTVFG
jgi:hypothetical protein